jgi:hypothetical protein
MILTYRRPDPPDTHVLTMVNNVIEVLNYVIAAHPPPLNYVIADINSAREPFNYAKAGDGRSQRHRLSEVAVARNLPSAENASCDAVRFPSGCPMGSPTGLLASVSQRRTVLSVQVTARKRPSGENIIVAG